MVGVAVARAQLEAAVAVMARRAQDARGQPADAAAQNGKAQRHQQAGGHPQGRGGGGHDQVEAGGHHPAFQQRAANRQRRQAEKCGEPRDDKGVKAGCPVRGWGFLPPRKA
jgi:hypothetical protein